MLLSHLPREAATVQALAGEVAEWGTSEHLLAAAVDALHVQIWMNAKKGMKRPEPIRRPGDRPAAEERRFKAERTYKPAELDELFGGVDNEGGE